MTKSFLPADYQPRWLQLLISDAEKLPFDFSPFGMQGEVCHLTTGDYTYRGAETRVTVERKSISDLVGCCGCGREPFQREIDRLRGFQTKAVVVEGSWSELERGEWRSKIKPQCVVASVLGWIAEGVPFVLAGTREKAAEYTARILFIAARREWRLCRALAAGVVQESTGAES